MFPLAVCAEDGRSVIIRIAEVNDRARIIGNINTIAAESIYLQTERFVSTPAWETVLADGHNLQQGWLLALPEVEGDIAGHLRIFPGSYGARSRHIGSIGLALLPPYREIGIGSALLNGAVAWARLAGFEKLEAYLLGSNLRARRLFARFGFAGEGVRLRQLKIGDRYEDEVIMARPLGLTQAYPLAQAAPPLAVWQESL